METTLKTLLSRFRGKPEWQSPDPAVRAEAVLRIPSSEREVLVALAREDEDARVRRAAVRKLSDAAVLAAIGQGDADAGVRDEAAARLVHLAVHEADEDLATAAVLALKEARHQAAVAKSSPRPTVREAAINALADPRALASIVREAEDATTRLLALARIEDPTTLLALALKSEAKAVAVAAVERLSGPDGLREVAERARSGAAARRARARLEEMGASTPAAAATTSPDEDERERQAYEAARAAHEREAAARAEAVAARAALCDSIERAEGEAIPGVLERARAAWLALTPSTLAEAQAIAQRFEAAATAASRRLEAYRAGLARRGELQALLATAEEAAAIADLAAACAAFAPIESQWKQATAAADLPDLRARFEAAADALHARERATRQEHAQKDQENRARLSALADRAEALLAREDVALRDADHVARELREALEHPGHFPSRRDREQILHRLETARKELYPRLQQLREDAEWKRWANVSVQEELCARAERLRQETDLEKAADALRDLDARWKQAREAPKEKAEALWSRFKSARDEVKARVDAFFAKQAEELASNLRRKEELCARAEALAGSTDWVRAAGELRALQAEWKAVGPVPRTQARAVWQRFREPCDRFFTRWQEHRAQRSHEWAENLTKKESLCARVEALQDSTDWESAAAEVRRLQTEWRSIGPVKRTKSEAVWQRFRAACDRFFDRYKNRDEAARQAALAAREALCAELETLLPGDGEQGEPPADLLARLQAALTAWRQAGELPRDLMAPLAERFARARDRVVEAWPQAFAGTELDPEATRRRAEKLLERVEHLLAELAPTSAATAETPEDLAARLRDALASNTIGGRVAVEARWQAATSEVEAAQATWRRLGPMPGPLGRDLADRFERACHRFIEARPHLERTGPDRPRRERPRPAGAARTPRQHG